jgi:hypothetical protein
MACLKLFVQIVAIEILIVTLIHHWVFLNALQPLQNSHYARPYPNMIAMDIIDNLNKFGAKKKNIKQMIYRKYV